MGFSSSEVLTGNCSGFLPYAISTICTACEWRKRRRWCRRSLCTIACCGCWSKQGTTTVVTVLLRICRILAIGFKISENERTHVAVNTGFSKASFAPGGLLWCCFWHLGLGGTARWLAFGQDNKGQGSSFPKDAFASSGLIMLAWLLDSIDCILHRQFQNSLRFLNECKQVIEN